MEIFKIMQEYDYEQLIFCQIKAPVKAIIAIHDTTLGRPWAEQESTITRPMKKRLLTR